MREISRKDSARNFRGCLIMIHRFDEMSEWLSVLCKLLSAYESATDRLLASDINQNDVAAQNAQINELLATREDIIQRINSAMGSLYALIEEQDAQHTGKSALLQRMLRGESMMSALDSEDSAIYTQVLDLRSIHHSVMNKDRDFELRFRRRLDEVRNELVGLQQQKKKLDFYNSAKHTQNTTDFHA
jgi:hypothetical protein